MGESKKIAFKQSLSKLVSRDADHYFFGRNKVKPSKSLDYWTKHNALLMAEEVFYESRNAVSSKLDFIFSCIGYSLGLGNTWRFPISCLRSGGGSFLIVYVILTIVIGLPLLISELCISQFTSKGVAECWYFAPGFRGIGYSMVLTNLCTSICYTVILGWVLFYAISSLQFVIPFLSCSNPWNDVNCVLSGVETFNVSKHESSAEQFWFRFVSTRVSYDGKTIFHMQDGPYNLIWYTSSCMIISWTISAAICTKGAKIVQRWNFIASSVPYLIMFSIIGLSVRLPGSLQGLIMYFRPRFKYFFLKETWCRAVEQIFFSFGIGLGGMLTMGSHNKFNRNLKYYVFFIWLFNLGTALLSGLTMFLLVGFMIEKYSYSISELTEMAGNGFFFFVYPECFGSIKLPQIISCIYFAMIFIHGIDSMFIIIRTVITGFSEVFPIIEDTKYHLICFGLVMHVLCAIFSLIFVTKTGYEWFAVFEKYSLSFSLTVSAFFESFVIAYIYSCKNLSRDYNMMVGETFSWFWKFLFYLTPVILLSMICLSMTTYRKTTIGYGYHLTIVPMWADFIGMLILITILIPIPVYFLVRVRRKMRENKLTFKAALTNNLTPNLKWGPMKKRNWLLDNYYRSRLTPLKEESENYQKDGVDTTENIVVPSWFHQEDFQNCEDVEESSKSIQELGSKSIEENLPDTSDDIPEN
uniref:Slc6a-19 n=1 Tax=Schmidtea mediterranea TaxID=79327 RepID=A0A0H3YIZ6_SCHMD|nr:slc6a-19 [Schmidtea mediterranea]